MISNIQLLRGLAAFAVAFYHAGYVIPGTVYSDFLAVPIFFVISGFIMTHITRVSSDYFLLHRLIRIVPLYWLATLAYAALVAVIYPVMGKHSDNVVTISTLLRDLFFIPRLDDDGVLIFPVLSVGWTLNLEMYFYLIFAGALQISRRAAPVIVAVVVLIVWFWGYYLPPPSPIGFYAHHYVIYFPLGIAAYYAAQLPIQQAKVGALTTFTGIATLIGFATTAQPIMALIAPPLIVVSAVLLERGGVICRYRFAMALGASSYALYLCHAFVIGLFREATKLVAGFDMREHLPPALLAVALSVLAAWIISKWIEVPLLTYLRTNLLRPAKTGSIGTRSAEKSTAT
jgi:exopolysaccharide production protein ExoZ